MASAAPRERSLAAVNSRIDVGMCAPKPRRIPFAATRQKAATVMNDLREIPRIIVHLFMTKLRRWQSSLDSLRRPIKSRGRARVGGEPRRTASPLSAGRLAFLACFLGLGVAWSRRRGLPDLSGSCPSKAQQPVHAFLDLAL